MNTRRWIFQLIVVLIVVSLVGLLGVQVYLLNAALQLKEQALQRNAIAALNLVAQKLEQQEALAHMFKVSVGVRPPTARKVQKLIVTTDLNTVSSGNGSANPDRFPVFSGWNTGSNLPPGYVPLRMSGDTVYYWGDHPQRVTLRMYDAAGSRDTILVDTMRSRGKYSVTVNHHGGNRYFYKYTSDSSSFFLQVGTHVDDHAVASAVTDSAKEALVNGIVDRLVVAEQQPITQRVKQATLDSLLRTSLSDAGISIPFAYAVEAMPDSLLSMMQPAEYHGELRSSDLRARLFPADIFTRRHDLVLFFPSRSAFLLRQIWPQLTATIVFMLIIALSFIYTIRTIIEQKRVSLLMTDFINNMTHEFKTPISTVALAVEAILRPDVIARQEKIRRYSGIIMDENARMRKQVEKILQMAVLERGEYELHMTGVDAHEIIAKAVEGIALQVEDRQGSVIANLGASRKVIHADPLHFANIINNLLDNANKYSPDAPRILVTTENQDDMLVIRIEDNGTGIQAEDLPKVFDKYYRVPTGNLHDVKGFGLGLSYVKLMVTAMGGTVSINSRYGEGTVVEVRMREEQ